MTSTDPPRIRPFQFYLFAPKTPGWRPRRLILLAVFLLLTGYIVAGIFPDQSLRLSKLRGLTPKQIITKFGRPALKWTGAGKLYFGYQDSWRWRAFRYAVIFKHNRVVAVTVNEK